MVQGGGLAEVLKTGQVLKPVKGPWAVDRLMLTYLAGTSGLLIAYWRNVAEAPLLMALHAAAVGLILLAWRSDGRLSWFFRNWYPLPLVSFCYREMSILIPAVWGRSFDGLLADLDFAIWRANPTVWLERIQTPNLTEFLQIIYTLFVPVVLLVPSLLWANRRYKEFRYCAFLIALGFVVTYVGYLIVPARGPRYLLDSLQHQPLEGRWFFHWMRATLDRIESVHYDCFPSGHTELTILAWWSSRQISKRLGWVYFVYTLCIIFATVYLRYHYTIDLAAGVLAAWFLIRRAPVLYRRLGGEPSLAGSGGAGNAKAESGEAGNKGREEQVGTRGRSGG
jgi:membrane-associated phospholipid phosphatase